MTTRTPRSLRHVGMLEGELAWRQHEGGHTDVPNFKYFISWADRFMGRPAPALL